MIYAIDNGGVIEDGVYKHTPITIITPAQFEQGIRQCYYKTKTINEIESLKANKPVNIKPKYPFWIVTSIFNQTVPMIDCDTEEQYQAAISELERLKISYVAFRSSPNKCWIFCDKLDQFENTIDFLLAMPGDGRYPYIGKQRGCLVVRAVPRIVFVPHQFKIEGEISLELDCWLKCFNQHWESESVNFILADLISKDL